MSHAIVKTVHVWKLECICDSSVYVVTKMNTNSHLRPVLSDTSPDEMQKRVKEIQYRSAAPQLKQQNNYLENFLQHRPEP